MTELTASKDAVPSLPEPSPRASQNEKEEQIKEGEKQPTEKAEVFPDGQNDAQLEQPRNDKNPDSAPQDLNRSQAAKMANDVARKLPDAGKVKYLGACCGSFTFAIALTMCILYNNMHTSFKDEKICIATKMRDGTLDEVAQEVNVHD